MPAQLPRVVACLCAMATFAPLLAASRSAALMSHARGSIIDQRRQLQLEAARFLSTKDEKKTLDFLVENMPPPDVGTVDPEYLAENVQLAVEAWQRAPWYKSVPWEIFLNYVAPYSVITEPRDDWRPLFKPLVNNILFGDSGSIEYSQSEAILEVNQQLWAQWDPPIHFVPDQTPQTISPFDVINARAASCTGLSIFLINALRAAGLPARMAGIPQWNTPEGGNHNWVEVWIEGTWHFVGAAEPDPQGLDHAWFYPYPANTSLPGDTMSSVYATSWASTPSGLHFPLFWDLDIKWVHADEVTDAYLPAKHQRALEPLAISTA